MAQRNEAARQAILDSTITLLDARGDGGVTVQKLTIEAIAKKAGVSKATIYRWWPNKAAVVLDAFINEHLGHTPIRSDVPAIEALRSHVLSVIRQYGGPEGRLVSQLIAEGQYDPDALEAFRERFWLDRARAARGLIERAQSEGSIREEVDPNIAASIVYAPIYQRLLLGAPGELTDEFAEEVVTAALKGLAV